MRSMWTPDASSGTRTIVCWWCRPLESSFVRPMKMAIFAFGWPMPVEERVPVALFDGQDPFTHEAPHALEHVLGPCARLEVHGPTLSARVPTATAFCERKGAILPKVRCLFDPLASARGTRRYPA